LLTHPEADLTYYF